MEEDVGLVEWAVVVEVCWLGYMLIHKKKSFEIKIRLKLKKKQKNSFRFIVYWGSKF